MGSDVLHTLAIEPTWFHTRLVAFCCLSFVCLIHGCLFKHGLRLQNALGLFKLVVLVLIVISGLLSLFNVAGFQVRPEYESSKNFRSWDDFWGGSGTGVNAFVNGLYNVIWYAFRLPSQGIRESIYVS